MTPERIVYAHGGGKKGDSGAHFKATWTFKAQGDKTKITLRMVLPSAAAREHVVKTYGAIEGGKETLERLSGHLAKRDRVAAGPGRSTLVITRVFDAPQALVWNAWTDPKHMAQWWGPKGFTNPVCKLDLRPGGAIRVHMRAPDGTVYPMTGEFQEIVVPERLVFTSAALNECGSPLFEVLHTVTFAKKNRKTAVTLQARVVKSTAEAAPYLQGMEAGWTQSLERLTEYLATARICCKIVRYSVRVQSE